MLKNKKHKDNLYVFVGYVGKRGIRERERKRKQKSGDDQAKLNVEESDG